MRRVGAKRHGENAQSAQRDTKMTPSRRMPTRRRAGRRVVGAVCQASPMRGPTAADVLGRVTLVTGKEEFLSERTVVGVRAAVRRHDAEAEISETQATGLSLAQLGELSAPSLFSSTRCVVVRGLENLPEESVGRPAGVRRGTGRGRLRGAGPRRRAEGIGCAHQAAQAPRRDRGEVRGAARVGVPRVRHRGGALARGDDRAGRRVGAGAGRRSGSPRRWPPPPTSWPTTSPARP